MREIGANARATQLKEAIATGLDVVTHLALYFSGPEMDAFLSWAGYGPKDEEDETLGDEDDDEGENL